MQKRRHIHIEKKEGCTRSSASLPVLFVAEAIDCSEGGLDVIYEGKKLYPGSRLYVSISDMDITDREAEVVWSMESAGKISSGLKWT